jgi:putative transposase
LRRRHLLGTWTVVDLTPLNPRLNWNPQLYKKYVPLVGSATAQQVVRKNNEAWRSFLALKRMEKRGELPTTMRRVVPPGYWKRDGR